MRDKKHMNNFKLVKKVTIFSPALIHSVENQITHDKQDTGPEKDLVLDQILSKYMFLKLLNNFKSV